MRWLDPLGTTIRGCGAIIWLAAWLVPKPLRKEWRQIWREKVWHWANFLAESGGLDRSNRLLLTRHCWSAFEEAFWIRWDREQLLERKTRLQRSPAACLVVCFMLLIAFAIGGGFVGRSRSLLSSPIPNPDRVAVITFDGKYVRVRSETLLYLGSVWRASSLLKEFALYSWAPGKLADDSGQVAVIESRVAPGFFQLLGLRPELGRLPDAGGNYECADCAVLSHEFWQTRFGGDRNVIGRSVLVDGHAKRIIGVLPQSFGMLSSSAAVWTTLDESTLRFSNFMNRVGGVASLREGASPQAVQNDLLDRSENAGYRFSSAPMAVASLQTQSRRMFWAYTGFLLLALACAAGIAWILRSGAGGFGPVSRDKSSRRRWWVFLSAKSAALLGAVYFLSWALVHHGLAILGRTVYPLADEVAIWVFLPLAVAVLCWSIADQQKRCRTCLRRMGMPIDIGRPGSVLLNWAGTELVCSEGHGTLYVPESESNALQRDRWNALDDSWAGLFRTG
jgi:hypothetical protein